MMMCCIPLKVSFGNGTDIEGGFTRNNGPGNGRRTRRQEMERISVDVTGERERYAEIHSYHPPGDFTFTTSFLHLSPSQKRIWDFR